MNNDALKILGRRLYDIHLSVVGRPEWIEHPANEQALRFEGKRLSRDSQRNFVLLDGEIYAVFWNEPNVDFARNITDSNLAAEVAALAVQIPNGTDVPIGNFCDCGKHLETDVISAAKSRGQEPQHCSARCHNRLKKRASRARASTR